MHEAQPVERQAEKERLIGAALARNVASFRRPDVGWRALRDALVGRSLSGASLAFVVNREAKLAPARADSPFAMVSDLIHKIELAVVQIETRTTMESGFVLDPAGLIVT